jgi:hypothetical protein
VVGRTLGDVGKAHNCFFEVMKGAIKDIMNARNINVLLGEY